MRCWANVAVTGAMLYHIKILDKESRGSDFAVMLVLKTRNLEWWRTRLPLPPMHRDQTPHSAVLEFFSGKK